MKPPIPDQIMPTTKTPKKKAARKAGKNKGVPARSSRSRASRAPLRSGSSTREPSPSARSRATAQATSTPLADAFRRGQDDRTQWYEQHIRDNFIEGRAGTKWFSQRMPQHLRDMHSTLAETIAHYVEELERKANLWDKRADLLQEEQGKLKAGEYVVALESWGWYDKGRVYEVMKNPLSESGISMKGHGKGVNSYHEDYRNRFRYANANEIDAFKAEEREGLEEGDWCNVSLAEVKQLRALDLPLAGPCSLDDETARVKWMCDHGHREPRLWSHPGEVTKGQPRRWSEFLRRAKLTAEKLRAAREEEEAKKPLAFGDLVRWKDEGSFVVLEHVPGYSSSYLIWRPGTTSIIGAPRKELTVLNN